MGNCMSTHGGSGYTVGSYWDGEDIVCGGCGTRIHNPRPTGGTFIADNGFMNALRGLFCPEKMTGHCEPRWPEFILGTRGKKWEGKA